MFKRICTLATLATFTLSLSCGPKVGEELTATLSGSVHFGPVANATVDAFRYVDGQAEATAFATARTNEQGQFTIEMGAHSGPALICATNGAYVEAAVGTVAQTGNDPLCVIIPDFVTGTDATVVITPWTGLQAVLSDCLVENGTLDRSAATTQAIERLTDFLSEGHQNFDLLQTVPIDILNSDVRDLSAESWAGLSLAALSRLAADIAIASGLEPGVSITSSSLFASLANDIDDRNCRLDGLDRAASQIVAGTESLSPDTLRGAPNGLASALLRFATSAENRTAISRVDLVPVATRLALHQSSIFGPIFAPPDFDAPAVTFTQPTETNLGGTFPLTIDANDAVGLVSVELAAPAAIREVIDCAGANECQLNQVVNTSVLSDGPVSFVAIATDTNGNTARATFDGIINNTLPVISITSPSENGTVSGPVTVVASANDPEGIASLQVEVEGLGVLSDDEPSVDSLSAVWDTTRSFEGNVEVTFRAADIAGNESTETIVVNVDNVDATIVRGTVDVGEPVDGATVRLFTWENRVVGDLVGEAISNNSGGFQIPAPENYDGALLVIANGGQTTDLATDFDLVIPEDLELMSPIGAIMAGTPNVEANVNVWTTIAARRAAHTPPTTDDALAVEQNLQLISDHLQRPNTGSWVQKVVSTDLSRVGAAAGSQEAVLALSHAGLSRYAADLSVESGGAPGTITFADVIGLLVEDVAIDPILNGSDSGIELFLGDAIQDSYLTRVSLASSIDNFVRDVPLPTVSHPRNLSGLRRESLLVRDGLYDDLALDDNTALFPLREPALSFDVDPPLINYSFVGIHAGASDGDVLTGEVSVTALITDTSELTQVNVLPTGIVDSDFQPQVVRVSFPPSVEPNRTEVHNLCPLAPPQDSSTNAVCLCVDATDSASNQSQAIRCFNRTTPTIGIQQPRNGSTEESSVRVFSVADAGFAIESCQAVLGGASSQTIQGNFVAGGTRCIIDRTLSLQSGSYSLRATVTDAAGDSASVDSAFVVDDTPPDVTLNLVAGPAVTETNGSTYTNSSSYSFTGTAVDPSGVQSVEVRVALANGTTISAPGILSGDSFSASFNDSRADGVRNAFAVVTDTNDNTSQSSIVSFVVDTTAPTVLFRSPASQAGLSELGGFGTFSRTGENGTYAPTEFYQNGGLHYSLTNSVATLETLTFWSAGYEQEATLAFDGNDSSGVTSALYAVGSSCSNPSIPLSTNGNSAVVELASAVDDSGLTSGTVCVTVAVEDAAGNVSQRDEMFFRLRVSAPPLHVFEPPFIERVATNAQSFVAKGKDDLRDILEGSERVAFSYFVVENLYDIPIDFQVTPATGVQNADLQITHRRINDQSSVFEENPYGPGAADLLPSAQCPQTGNWSLFSDEALTQQYAGPSALCVASQNFYGYRILNEFSSSFRWHVRVPFSPAPPTQGVSSASTQLSHRITDVEFSYGQRDGSLGFGSAVSPTNGFITVPAGESRMIRFTGLANGIPGAAIGVYDKGGPYNDYQIFDDEIQGINENLDYWVIDKESASRPFVWVLTRAVGDDNRCATGGQCRVLRAYSRVTGGRIILGGSTGAGKAVTFKTKGAGVPETSWTDESVVPDYGDGGNTSQLAIDGVFGNKRDL